MPVIPFEVSLDLVEQYVPAEDITVTQEDFLSVLFSYSIFNKGERVDLTGTTNHLVSFFKQDNTVIIQDDATVVDNKIQLTANPQAFSYVGKVYAQVQYKRGTATFTTRKMFFNVERSFMSCQTLKSTSYAPILDTAVQVSDQLAGQKLDDLLDGKQLAMEAQQDIDLVVTPQLNSQGGRLITVEDKLNKSFVTYEEFGAKLDGVIDDTVSIQNAHKYANLHKIPVVQRDSIFKLNGQVNVQTDTDLSGSTVITSWLHDVFEYDRTNILYNITGAPTETITEVVQSEFTKGATVIPSLANIKSSVILIETTAQDFIRNDGGNTGVVYKTEANMIMKNQTGTLVYPLTKDYTTSTGFKVSIRELENQLTFKAPSIELVNAGLSSIFKVNRNNVFIDGGLVKEISNLTTYKAPLHSFVRADRCCDLTIYNPVAPVIGREVKTGEYGLGYFLLFDRMCGVTIDQAKQQSGWSSVNGNYFRDITVTNSKLIYVGGHANVYDIRVRDCSISKKVSAHGGGVMEVSNCVITGDATSPSIETRLDYAGEWDGIIRISNTRTLFARRLITLNMVNYDCGRQVVLPRVEINNVYMENTNDVDIELIDFRGWGGNYNSTLPSFYINGADVTTKTNKVCRLLVTPNTITNTALSGVINVVADNIRTTESSYLTNIYTGARATFMFPNITNANLYFNMDIRNSIANFSVVGTSNVSAYVRNSDVYILRALSGLGNITSVGEPLKMTWDNCTLYRVPSDLGTIAGAPTRVKLQVVNSRWLRVKKPDGTLDPIIAFTTENVICYSRNNVVDPLGTIPATNGDRLFNYVDPTVWRTTI